MIPKLRKHKLAFTISHEHFGNDEDLVYELVHEHLVEHLALHVLTLPSNPRTSGNTDTDLGDGQSLSFHNLPWTVLLKSRTLPQKDVKFYYKSDLNGYNITLRLLKGSHMVKHPHDKNHLLLFIASAADANPSSARRRRMGSLSMPTAMSFAQPQLAETGLTPAVTMMALMSGRIGVAPLPASATVPPLNRVSPLLPSPSLSSGSTPLQPLHTRALLARSNRLSISDSSDDSDHDSLPDVSAADLVSQVNRETGRSAPRETQEIQSARPHAPTAVIPATSSVGNSPSLIPIAPPASQATMQDWCDILTELADANTVNGTLEFYGDDLDSVARALQAYLVYLAATASSKEGEVLTWTLPAHIQKFSEFASITEVMSTRARLYRAGRGAGAGVERTVLITAVRNMVGNSAYWADRGAYKIPTFFENHLTNPRRLATWEAFGQLCCLYLFYRKLGPIPVCPSLLMVCLLSSIGPTDDEDFGVLKDRCGGNYSSSGPYMSAVLLPIMSLPIIAAIDLGLAQTLQPWFEFSCDMPTPKDLMHPVLQFVIDALGRNPINFTSTRTPEDPNSHDNWSCQAFLRVLYNHDTSFLGLQEFQVFCRGLMAPFPGESDFAQTVTETVNSRTEIPEFVLGLYIRTVDDIDQFIAQRLIFHFTADQGHQGKGKAKADSMVARQEAERNVAERTFVAFFIRYLRGQGHPDHPQLRDSRMISPADFELHANSKTLRVEMLLRALTDSPMMPLDDLWCIHIAFDREDFVCSSMSSGTPTMSESPAENSRHSSPGSESQAQDEIASATAEELSQQLQSLSGRQGHSQGFNLMNMIHRRPTQPASAWVVGGGISLTKSSELAGVSTGSLLPVCFISANGIHQYGAWAHDGSTGSQSMPPNVPATVTREDILEASFGQIRMNFCALDGSQYGTGYVRYLKVSYYEMICKAVGLTQATQSHVEFYGCQVTRANIASWLGQPFGTLNNWRTFYTKCHKAYNALAHHDGQLTRDTNEELLWQVLRRWIESSPEVLDFDYPRGGNGDAIDKSWHSLAVKVKANKIAGGIEKLKEKQVYAALMY
ncbi:hypothetical protein C8T65DRAFT_700767 [Cerioporus squamosus]|nr:hypothetical protein C8T65DRAFT_700767 [Cerioporus squamosus]